MKKSIIFIYLVASLFGISSCDKNPVPAPKSYVPVITNLSMSTAQTISVVNISWTYPAPATVTSFKVQYSINHAEWITYATVPGTTTSLPLNSSIGVGARYHNYKWRVVAITAIGVGEFASDCMSASVGSSQSQQLFGVLQMVGDYDVSGSGINFKVSPSAFSSVANLSFILTELGSTTTTNVTETLSNQQTALPFSFNLPANLLQPNKLYSIRAISNVSANNTVATNSITFTYAQPHCL